MGKCFVIQPFDGGIFDRRYDEVFVPAIEKTGLDPYRVDRDPAVSIPIVDIEKGIHDAEICLAEITTDNPNVWFELGFAIAAQKEVVLVCSNERQTRFPFDVQHRNIIKYNTALPSDFSILSSSISERLCALLKKEKQIAIFASSSPIADTEGLSPHEMVALITIMQNQFPPQESVSPYQIKDDMARAGFTGIAASMSLRGLTRKGFIMSESNTDINGNTYSVYKITEKGEDWLFNNESKLTLRHPNTDPESSVGSGIDDMPF